MIISTELLNVSQTWLSLRVLADMSLFCSFRGAAGPDAAVANTGCGLKFEVPRPDDAHSVESRSGHLVRKVSIDMYRPKYPALFAGGAGKSKVVLYSVVS